MTRYRKKRAAEIEATVWNQNGDHPDDRVGEPTDDGMYGTYDRIEGAVVRFFRHPEYPGQEVHKCGRTWHDHGWLDVGDDGEIVCPGDYVITEADGTIWSCRPDIFAATYEPVEDA